MKPLPFSEKTFLHTITWRICSVPACKTGDIPGMHHSNKYKSPAQQCDCEKKAGFDKSGSNNDPLSKNHTHIHLEELFQHVKENIPHFSCSFLPGKKYQFSPDDLCEGITVELFRPPCV